jgi:HEAT repeat protein
VALYAAEALSNLGDAAGSERLVGALAPDRDASIRLYAAWTLGRLRDPRGLPVVEELRGNPDPQVRMQAVWTLGELGDGAGVFGLRQSARDTAPSVRWQAAWSLARKMGS